jgi:hypothetical protein
MIVKEGKHYEKIDIKGDPYYKIIYSLLKNELGLEEISNDQDSASFRCPDSGLLVSIHSDHVKMPIINKNNKKYLEGTPITEVKSSLLGKLN